MSRNKEVNLKVKEERRERIRSAALKLFAANGLSATKISEIASASGMSQGLLYHYYRSKEEVYTELIRNAFDKLNTASCELEKHTAPPREKIRMALEAMLLGLANNEDTAWYHLLIAQAGVADSIPAEVKTIIEEESSVPYEIITRIIIEGQTDGSIKQYDARDMALVFWTSIKGLAFHKAVHGAKYIPPDANILMNMF